MSTQRRKQDAAVAVFRELGWDGAAVEQVMDLPLGTEEQRRVAREGLEKGEWEGFLPAVTTAEEPEEDGDWGNFWGTDSKLLGLFAARVGVSPRRAAAVLGEHSSGWVEESRAVPIAAILAERGADFALRYIDAASARVDAGWWEAADAALLAVHAQGFPLPEAPAYLEAYADRLSIAFKAEDEGWDPDPNGGPAFSPEQFRQRFAEHAAAGVVVASATSEAWAAAIAGATARGWVPRETALDLVWTGLDAAQRPVARGSWVKALAGPLAVSDDELDAARDRLVPLLSLGHGPLVELVVPRLLARSTDEQAVELGYASLGAGTQKARVAVLKALAARPAPHGEARAELLGVVEPLLDGTPTEARAAAAVLTAWGAAPPAEDVAPGAEAARGRWNAVPALWSVPRFEVGEASAEGTLTLARRLAATDSEGATLESEDLLARFNALAWADPKAAQDLLIEAGELAFGGLDVERWEGAPERERLRTAAIARWGEDWEEWGVGRDEDDDWTGLIERRADALSRRPGTSPVLLSTPSTSDFVVDPDDLLDRLGRLAEASAPALEEDLLLALTRTRGTAAGPVALSAAQALRLAASAVPVVRWDGSLLESDAAQLVSAYLASPLSPPRARGFRLDLGPGVAGFRTLPLRGGSAGSEGLAVFPEWGETALQDALELAPDEWLLLAQRAEPLPPSLATSLVSGLCAWSADPHLPEAARLAWERGLLLPSAIQPEQVKTGLSLGPAGSRAALAGVGAAAAVLTEAGAASVAWGLLSRVLDLWADMVRPAKHVLVAIEALGELAPEALWAVEHGKAGIDVLRLPGLRALAARPGSSAVIGAARRVAAQIPIADDPADPIARLAPTMELDDDAFSPVWGPAAPEKGWATGADTGGAGSAPPADGSTLFFEGEEGAPTVVLLLSLPQEGESVQHGLTWPTDHWQLGRLDPETDPEGASYVELSGTEWLGESEPGREAWLRFSPTKGYRVGYFEPVDIEDDTLDVVGSPFGDEDFDVYWERQQNHPPERFALPEGLAALLLTLACTGDAAGRDARAELVNRAEEGTLTAQVVEAHLPAVLRGAHPQSPARLARAVEHPGALGALWPVLTLSVELAAELEGTPPRWLGTVLQVALAKAPVLKAAALRGLMPRDWPGLEALAARPGNSAALKKVRELKEALA